MAPIWQQCTLRAKDHFYVGVKQYPCGSAASNRSIVQRSND